jgi:hypothetical protein|tara:strand:+ start:360 stop:572 length:213 start_codon:yes stop_codon:yes gene_type:complete
MLGACLFNAIENTLIMTPIIRIIIMVRQGATKGERRRGGKKKKRKKVRRKEDRSGEESRRACRFVDPVEG